MLLKAHTVPFSNSNTLQSPPTQNKLNMEIERITYKLKDIHTKNTPSVHEKYTTYDQHTF